MAHLTSPPAHGIISSRGRSHRLNREPLVNDLPRSLLGSPRPSADGPARISAHEPSGRTAQVGTHRLAPSSLGTRDSMNRSVTSAATDHSHRRSAAAVLARRFNRSSEKVTRITFSSIRMGGAAPTPPQTLGSSPAQHRPQQYPLPHGPLSTHPSIATGDVPRSTLPFEGGAIPPSSSLPCGGAGSFTRVPRTSFGLHGPTVGLYGITRLSPRDDHGTRY